MKFIKSIALVCALVVIVCSCKKTINCETPVIKKVFFYSSISNLAVLDDTVDLVKFKKGSNFTLVSEIFPSIRLTKESYNKSMEFPENGEETYDYDWKITMHPSNRIYLISAIEHESATSKTHYCTNTVSYRINDSLVKVPGNPYSTTPYYVSDIQIQYH